MQHQYISWNTDLAVSIASNEHQHGSNCRVLQTFLDRVWASTVLATIHHYTVQRIPCDSCFEGVQRNEAREEHRANDGN